MTTSELHRQHNEWAVCRNRLWFTAPPTPPALISAAPAAPIAPPVPVRPRGRDWLVVGDRVDAEPRRLVRRTDPVWMRIAAQVAKKHELRILDLRSDGRQKHIVAARQEAIWRIKHETTMSLTAIGRKFNRDHATVLHSIKRHQERVTAE